MNVRRPSPIDLLAAKYQLAFGDNVVVKRTDVTVPLGLAGLRGQVSGHTTPSITRVEVVGECADDFAVGVHLEQRDQAVWFAPTLLEFVDHGAGTEISLDGVPKKWVRTATGEWQEYPVSASAGPRRSGTPMAWSQEMTCQVFNLACSPRGRRTTACSGRSRVSRRLLKIASAAPRDPAADAGR